MTHACNPRYLEGRDNRIVVQGQPEQKKLARLSPKKKKKSNIVRKQK
jgi:hypothetical protein